MNYYSRFIILFSVFVLVVSSTLFAQQDIRIKKSEFKLDNTGGLKLAWKNIKEADKFYDKGKDFHDEALKEYKLAYRYNGENAALNYKMGVCYLSLNQPDEAIEAFNKALSINEEVAVDIFYLLGKAYHLGYQFENAIRNYQRCLEEDIIKKLDKTKEDMNILIRQCNNGITLMNEPVRVNINNLGKAINSEYDDYGSVLHPNDSVVYFTSRRKHEDNDDRWIGDNKFYTDIFRAYKKNGQWQRAELVPKDLYLDENDAVIEITTKPYRIYIYHGDKDGGDIYYYEEKEKGKWRGPKSFDGMINTKDKETSICFTSDGRGIYFVSNMKDETVGKKDIFYSELNNKDKWTYPVNLGSLINTRLDEEGVFINATEDKLYFSSQGHNSMGGYDVFYSERDVDGHWKEPVNLGYPVNTPNDDLLFRLIDDQGKKAYYTSTRENTLGGKDIYEIIILGEEKDYLTMEAVELISWEKYPDTNLLYKSPSKLAIDTTIYLVGNVMDSIADTGVNSKIQVVDNEQNKIIATYLTDTTGEFKIRLPEKKKYGIEVTARNYLFFADNLDLNKMQIQNDSVYRDFYLDKVEIGKKVVLENIYFETSSDKLKPESFPELERVVELLKNNPTIRLEISGHTDNVGSYLTNKRLSEARAKSVVDYLVDKGINQNRLEYQGYSFTKPIAPNDTPEGRQKNRRVEFEILEK